MRGRKMTSLLSVLPSLELRWSENGLDGARDWLDESLAASMVTWTVEAGRPVMDDDNSVDELWLPSKGKF